ncbi:hypothetical protein KC19_4G162300 [Ceratodon purpureus]|uniref:HTH CENPB-type domain-containing protein n=1 Tax=Ceratodon purpureus TaxID=3225 RepID=A0A8T0ICV5_CERPU|nr:hypothetical protein KC19_4G162300 [Ceratodon purpureus]
MVIETLRVVHVQAREMAQRNSNAAKAQQEADGINRIAARNLKEVLNVFKDCVILVQRTKRMLEVDPKCACVNTESKWERRKELFDAAESVEATMEFLFRNIFQFRNIEASLVDSSEELPEHEVDGEFGRYRLQKRLSEDEDLFWCDRVCALEMHGPAGAMTRRSTAASRAAGSSGEQSRRRPSQIGQSRRRPSPSGQSRRQEFLRNLNDSGLNETGNPSDVPNTLVEYRKPAPKEQRIPRKNGDWSTSDLNKAIEMIEGGAKILTAARAVNIPVSTVRDHLLGRRKGRKRGRERILNDEEENELKAFLLKMHNAGQPLTPGQLKMKVAQLTQTRSTTFVDGVPGKSWMKGFRRRHPDLTNLLHFKSRTSNQLQVHRNLQGGMDGTDAGGSVLAIEGNALELPMDGNASGLPMEGNPHGLHTVGNVPEYRMEGSVGAFPMDGVRN